MKYSSLKVGQNVVITRLDNGKKIEYITRVESVIHIGNSNELEGYTTSQGELLKFIDNNWCIHSESGKTQVGLSNPKDKVFVTPGQIELCDVGTHLWFEICLNSEKVIIEGQVTEFDEGSIKVRLFESFIIPNIPLFGREKEFKYVHGGVAGDYWHFENYEDVDIESYIKIN